MNDPYPRNRVAHPPHHHNNNKIECWSRLRWLNAPPSASLQQHKTCLAWRLRIRNTSKYCTSNYRYFFYDLIYWVFVRVSFSISQFVIEVNLGSNGETDLGYELGLEYLRINLETTIGYLRHYSYLCNCSSYCRIASYGSVISINSLVACLSSDPSR